MIRLRSFENYPNKLVSVELLALTGFYYKHYNKNVGSTFWSRMFDYSGKSGTKEDGINIDETVCFFCKSAFKNWTCDREVIRAHEKSCRYCPLITRRRTQNVPIDEIKLDLTLPPLIYDECGSGWRDLHKTYYKKVQYPEYSDFSVRLSSFDTWPTSMNQKPKVLSAAGLYYTSIDDKTICFYCGLGLHSWAPTDDPWIEHAKWAKNCFYLEFIKGSEFVSMCKNQKTSSNNLNTKCFSQSETPMSLSLAKDMEPKNVQYKCFTVTCSNLQETTLLPCKHTILCAFCAVSIKNCPDCNAEVEGRIRYFFES